MFYKIVAILFALMGSLYITYVAYHILCWSLCK